MRLGGCCLLLLCSCAVWSKALWKTGMYIGIAAITVGGVVVVSILACAKLGWLVRARWVPVMSRRPKRAGGHHIPKPDNGSGILESPSHRSDPEGGLSEELSTVTQAALVHSGGAV
ncbi:hypothetical protein FISHEDRAFT_55928 [Fistulina hepatica ATCC 64428]|uniref:Uncharacterized protein n=1 Tax=Fistulina hepatica ATCC 64428 TaxID=1128425 RepID=A0A0D7ALH4_9AGAR|nr:hypothetical protein FISHEDRAFT_55928 [Fistulina hepatica ATCC 64428]